MKGGESFGKWIMEWGLFINYKGIDSIRISRKIGFQERYGFMNRKKVRCFQEKL